MKQKESKEINKDTLGDLEMHKQRRECKKAAKCLIACFATVEEDFDVFLFFSAVLPSFSLLPSSPAHLVAELLFRA